MNQSPAKGTSAKRWDAISLGEIMLRLDPGEARIRHARTFTPWEGGGEYNVAKGLSACFRLSTSVITSLVDNEIGRLVENLIRHGGVDTSNILWRSFDGIGRAARNGLNFTERGFGIRSSLGVSDRAHTAVSQLTTDEVDLDRIFLRDGTRWFHTGGIFAALSPTTAPLACEALRAAGKANTLRSFDFNYRPSLWKQFADSSAVRGTYEALLANVDVLFGGEADFERCLGLASPAREITDPGERFFRAAEEVVKRFPNITTIAATKRIQSGPVADFTGFLLHRGATLVSRRYESLQLLDRIGGGDSFVSGYVFGMLDGRTPQEALELGMAHAALTMTTPGDTTMVSRDEVEQVSKIGFLPLDR